MNLGILRETKIPQDKRVPLTPVQCKVLMETYPGLTVIVQPDNNRSYTDEEYMAEGIILSDHMENCDILIGVKEVAIDTLIPGKKYLFFSHTTKRQPQNSQLLKEILNNGITLIDYELLTAGDNTRVVAFGRWAGVVGAYNGLRAYGQRFHSFSLKPAWQCLNKETLFTQLLNLNVPDIKILITGGGRVANGAEETLSFAGIKQVSPKEFLSKDFNEPVYAQIDPVQYVKRRDEQDFDLQDFFNYPEEYENIFPPYALVTDVLMACHYWDTRSPKLLTRKEMTAPGFKIKIIADISCDVDGSISSTIRSSTISEPFYGYDPLTGEESSPFEKDNITIMAVDNLPSELPRDASEDFGRQLIKDVFPALIGTNNADMIIRATIASDGKLTERFAYLKDY